MKNNQAVYNSVKRFNEIAGSLNNVTDANVDLQMSLIFEELTETIDAFEAGDKLGLLDGACDLRVTVDGLIQILEALKYNVEDAMTAVCENNLSKFKSTVSKADKERYTVSLNNKHKVFVLKDGNGKIRKPDSYESVNLTMFVPKEG